MLPHGITLNCADNFLYHMIYVIIHLYIYIYMLYNSLCGYKKDLRGKWQWALVVSFQFYPCGGASVGAAGNASRVLIRPNLSWLSRRRRLRIHLLPFIPI